tara:strand:+ start:496 stop:621 length:126 start_codon:yes stop_codon:yes gene_type:complete
MMHGSTFIYQIRYIENFFYGPAPHLTGLHIFIDGSKAFETR